MSLLVGVFDPHADRPLDQVGRTMLSRTLPADGWRSALRVEGPVSLGAARPEWTLRAGFAGPVFVVEDGDTWVAADATLYYRDDLRRRMLERGVRPTGQTPSHLIAAAYRAWGERCAEYLEGDFAFVVWDRATRQIVAARDFMARRPLYYVTLPGGGIAFASTPHALLAHPRCPRDLDVGAIAECLASYVRPEGATCHTAIKRLEGGHTATCGVHRPVRVVRHWTPPPFEESGRQSPEESARQLRDLLQRAVRERVSHNTPTAVWMSGGRDSTAVFASAMANEGEHAARHEVFPVSMSYPEGDPGREDEYIASMAARWRATVRWVDVRDVPLLDELATHAPQHDGAFVHVFESSLRALARAGRSAGSHVALDGVGGDQLFSVSGVYLADLLAQGRLRTLAREWRAAGLSGSGVRTFVRWAVQPALPTWCLYAAGVFRGGQPLQGELRQRLPEWVHPTLARQRGLTMHVRSLPRPRRGETFASTEARWYLSDPMFHAIHSAQSRAALQHEVEVRSPLMDKRIVEFAATLPRRERCDAGRTKGVLLRAMEGLIPADVLADREGRTGLAGGYFARAMREGLESRLRAVFRDCRLAALGVVDQAALLRACDRYLATGHDELGLRLLLTWHAELWLRAREDDAFALAPAWVAPHAVPSPRHPSAVPTPAPA